MDQVNFNSNPFQVLILQYLIPTADLPHLPSLSKYFTLANGNPTSTQSSTYSSSVSLFCPTPFDNTLQFLDVPKPMPSQANKFITELYISHYILLAKHATYQKVESLRAASLSKLDNRVNNNYIFNIDCADFSCTCTFTFTTLLVLAAIPAIFTKISLQLTFTSSSVLTCS